MKIEMHLGDDKQAKEHLLPDKGVMFEVQLNPFTAKFSQEKAFF